MIDILEELDAASTLLRAALDRYLSACLAIQGCYTDRNATNPPLRKLSRRVTDELPHVSSYEAKINEAKAAISISRNNCTGIAPINSLPNEILAQIFHLIHNAQLCASDDSPQPTSLNPIYVCSFVCSRWRQISISLGTLWSRIDLSLAQSSRRYLDRALGHAARASDTPLDICIFDTFKTRDKPSATTLARMHMFLPSIVHRIRSLTLDFDDLNKPHPSVLRACFGSCIPGVLTRLVLNARSGCCFLEAAEDLQPQIYQRRRESMGVNVSKQVLEDLWLHITVLQLHQLYLPWTSKAYQGLTKLQLTGSMYNCRVPERQLIEILRSSPQLRVLCFGLEITNSDANDVSVVPVYLGCLEVLVWESKFSDSTLFRLIAPGLKPLHVFLNTNGIPHGPIPLGEMREFFARSNVTKIHLSAGPPGSFSLKMLDVLPPLEVLVLESGYIYSPVQGNDLGEPEPDPAYPSCFQALHLIKSHTHVDGIIQVIQRYSVQKPMIQLPDPDLRYVFFTLMTEDIKKRLRAVCPAAEVFGWDEPSPLDSWDKALARLEFI